MLRIGKQMEVRAKGFEQPVTLSEVVAIGGPYKLAINQEKDELWQLAEEFPFSYRVIEGDHLNGRPLTGALVRLSLKRAEVRLEQPVAGLTNLEIHLLSRDGFDVLGTLYAKVSATPGNNETTALHFTSMAPEIETFLREAVLKATKSSPPSVLVASAEAPFAADRALH
jgi:hypothetical protein